MTKRTEKQNTLHRIRCAVLTGLMALSIVSLSACGGKTAAESAGSAQGSAETIAADSAEVSSEASSEASEEEAESSGQEVGAESETEESVSAELTELVFVFNGTEIAMDADAEPVLAALGDAGAPFEYMGCAGLGTMRTYYYNGFELGTYENEEGDGKECIYSVNFTNDIVETKEGLCIGDSMETASEIYGACGEVENDVITVSIENTMLTIQGEDGTVTAIQYLSKAASSKM